MKKYRIAANGISRTFHIEVQLHVGSSTYIPANYMNSDFLPGETNEFFTKQGARRFYTYVLRRREQQREEDENWAENQGYEYL